MWKSDPKRDPKGQPKPSNSRMYDLSKHMVFTVRITHFAVLDVLWDPFFFTPFFGHCFFITFSLFEKLGARIVPKMDEYSMQKIWQIQPCHQKAPMRPQGEPRAFQMTPKCSPKVLKWCPRDPKNWSFTHTATPHKAETSRLITVDCWHGGGSSRSELDKFANHISTLTEGYPDRRHRPQGLYNKENRQF